MAVYLIIVVQFDSRRIMVITTKMAHIIDRSLLIIWDVVGPGHAENIAIYSLIWNYQIICT